MSMLPIATYFSIQGISWENDSNELFDKCERCSKPYLYTRTTNHMDVEFFCLDCAVIQKSIDSINEDDLSFEQNVKGE